MALKSDQNQLVVFIRQKNTIDVYNAIIADSNKSVAQKVVNRIISYNVDLAQRYTDKCIVITDFLQDQLPEGINLPDTSINITIGSLSEQLCKLFYESNERGYDHSLILLPLTTQCVEKHLEEADQAIKKTDCIFGTTKSGHVYLIACKGEVYKVLKDVDFSRFDILSQMLGTLWKNTYSGYLLENLPDISSIDDLAYVDELSSLYDEYYTSQFASKSKIPREHDQDMLRTYRNNELSVFWDPSLCHHTSICTTKLGQVFNTAKRPWVDLNAASTDEIIKVVEMCPTKAITYKRNLDLDRCNADSGVSSDSAPTTAAKVYIKKDGPLLIDGEFQIFDATGHELKKQKIVALCRCGASARMPYCDGMHVKICFTDPKV